VAYLGIDQALGCSGIAILGEEGETLLLEVVRTGALTGATRLVRIRDELEALLTPHGIRMGSIEGYAYGAVGRSFELGEVGGIVRALLHDLAIPFLVIAPAALKKFVSGSPMATKAVMREKTREKWGIDIAEDDACDAYGLARVARAYVTEDSTNRHELEVLKKVRASGRDPLGDSRAPRQVSV